MLAPQTTSTARPAVALNVVRASEWRHKSVELAAHELLQNLDAKTM